tara:strand:+ start:2093 stop:2350 length:258 start_codon:yes stop_codon:yes gene_type:complete
MKIDPLPLPTSEDVCPWCFSPIAHGRREFEFDSDLNPWIIECSNCKKAAILTVDHDEDEGFVLKPIRSEADLHYMAAMGIEEPKP